MRLKKMTKRIESDKPKPPFDRAAKKALAEERATEGAKAMTEYKAEGEAERAKTERLRALRLAKEAADKIAKQAKPTKKRWSAT
jgi:histone H3/H4